MDDARHAPIVGPAEAEEFFATGSNALTCEPDSRETFIDVPAVGPTPAAALPASLSRMVNDRPPSHLLAVEDLVRQGLLIQLLYAAHHLADANIVSVPCADAHRWCRECQMNEVGDAIAHASTCRTGRVMDLVERFYAEIHPEKRKRDTMPVRLNAIEPVSGKGGAA